MAADVTLGSEPSNSCCSAWKERFSKLEEKRNALRQAVKLLEKEVYRLQAENLELKKVCEQERTRADLQSEEKEKESSTRNELEKEICNSKAEISSLQKRECSGDGLLLSRVSEGSAEISRLKELLEKEKKRGDVERKKAETEKLKAAEAWNAVKVDKKKAEEEKRLADIGERKRAEEFRLCLESLKLEASKLNSKLTSEKSKAEQANRKAELEKQKADREKKRADSEMAKVEEQRKCTEVERQKVMVEKSRADHLSQQLEDERRKNEILRKETDEIISVGRAKKRLLVPHVSNVKAEVSNEKALKEQLKLEKRKMKRAERAAKLERNSLLQKELYLLKQDAIQFSRRLDILDGCFSRGMEGIDGLAKISLHFQNENDLTKTRHMATDALDHIGSTVECTGTLSFPGGSCGQPTSGISSELESLIGGSIRNESQNSVYSTSTSFSDRQLMGSQERGVLPTASAKLAEEKLRRVSAVTRLSCEVSEKNYRKNPAVSTGRNSGSLVEKPSGTPNLNSAIFNMNGVLDKLSGSGKKKKRIRNARESVVCNIKKKRIQDAPKSVACFNSNDQKLDLDIEEASLHDILVPASGLHESVCSQGGGNLEALLLHDLSSDNKLSKIRKADLTQQLVSQPCSRDNPEQKVQLGIEGSGDAYLYSCGSLPVIKITGACHAYRDKTIVGKSDQDATLCFDEMFTGDYMKLLELDNDEDEERFRIAMERPLSPTLPEIQSPKLCHFEVNNPNNSVEGLHREFASSLGCGACAAIGDTSAAADTLEIVAGRGVSSAAEPGQASVCHALLSDATSEVPKQMPIPNIQQVEVSFRGNNGVKSKSVPKYFILFPNTKDACRIFRIFYVGKSCISRISMVSQTHCIMSEVLFALALEHDLLPEEKASVFFSVLLHNFSAMILANSRSIKTVDSALFSDFLEAQLNKVISNVETRRLLLELCQGDILFTLIEHFLINGRVWVYNDAHCEAEVPCDAKSQVSSFGDGSLLLSETAAVDQLEAGGIILASICLAIDKVGFLCEASYNILRVCTGSHSWVLRVLHIFASVCGKKYFQQSNYSLVITSIKSVVLHLERGSESVGNESSSCLHPASEDQSGLSLCPFAEGALCLEKVMLLLMDKLEYAISTIKHQHPRTSVISSIFTLPSQMEGVEEVKYRHDTDGNISQCLLSGGVIARKTDGGAEKALYQLSDIISLVELLSCYMSWDWLGSNVFPRLLKLLDSCVNEELSAAVLVLIGQLWRLGIDAGGCIQKVLGELRCRLCAFLDENHSRERGLPFQFAAVRVLTDILHLGFKELIQKNAEISADTDSSGHEAVRKWFSQLSKEQQDLSLRLFESDL